MGTWKPQTEVGRNSMSESGHPNVIVFVTHDTGRHFGCYGIDTVHSPNIDRLADEGMRFDRFFAASPMCSPSRAAAFSGLYPQANGVMGLVHAPWHWRYNDGVQHLSHYFRAAGYRTAAAGIVHESHTPGESLGFDEYQRGAHADDVMAAGLPMLEKLATEDRPFYLQMGTFQTHAPFDFKGVEPDSEHGVYLPPQYVETERARGEFAAFQGSIRHVDAAFGELLAALDRLNLTENTLVVFTVDHGIDFPRAKATLYDPGLSVALLMRWPGRIGAGSTSDALLSNVDLTPTLLELAGVAVPADLHGCSFADLCRGSHNGPVRDAVFGEHTAVSTVPDTRCIRTERWKLIRSFFPSRQYRTPIDLDKPMKGGISPEVSTPFAELYDLEKDPLEFSNLACEPDHADTLRELNGALLSHLRDVNDPILDGPIRWPYYEEAIADLMTCEEPGGPTSCEC